ITLAFSILRYRLWDIDLTINRSLVYSLISLILVGVFALAFFVTQRLLILLIDDGQSGLAIALAGLLCGALFSPTRQRVRHFIDRRLYGFRFDLIQLARAQKKPEVKKPAARTGQVVGRYEMLDLLGQGGMGEVYKGYADGQIVAVKILPDALA